MTFWVFTLIVTLYFDGAGAKVNEKKPAYEKELLNTDLVRKRAFLIYLFDYYFHISSKLLNSTVP